MIDVGDDSDVMVELLREIRDEVADPESGSVTRNTDVNQNVIRASSSNGFVLPHNTIPVANEEWVDYDATPISPDGDLGPGDTETVASIEVTEQGKILGLKDVGVTSHTADLDGDTRDESVVEYRYDMKLESGPSWVRHKTLSGTLPLGSMTNPAEVVNGWLVGPIKAVRVQIHNRTDQSDLTDTTVPKDQLGARLTAVAFENQEG